jgi:serine/threonine protein kinase
MGVVFRAEHVSSGEPVALKILAEELGTTEPFLRRFMREARYAARVEHPNVVRVLDAGESKGRHYIAHQLVEGVDLRTRLSAAGTLDPPEALHVLGQVGAALDAVHAAGMLHRDVKPANVIIASGEGPEPAGHCYLADFGLIKDPGRESAALTGAWDFVGTVDYAAPEQASAGELGPQTDQYSLGCMLYECLVGEPPFQRETVADVITAHMQLPPPSVTARRPELPAAIDGVITRAMAKDARARFDSCTELVAAAAAALEPSEGVLRLLVTGGQASGTEIPLTDELEIGRQATGAGSLGGDVEISRRHALIRRGPHGVFEIEDLGSTNGTFVNGERIEGPRPLVAGDRLELGATVLQVVAAPAPAAPAPGTAPSAGRVEVVIELDFEAREAVLALDRGEDRVRLVNEAGRWRLAPAARVDPAA